jgi:hypothetical protein
MMIMSPFGQLGLRAPSSGVRDDMILKKMMIVSLFGQLGLWAPSQMMTMIMSPFGEKNAVDIKKPVQQVTAFHRF